MIQMSQKNVDLNSDKQLERGVSFFLENSWWIDKNEYSSSIDAME